jgi:hypothetical protein
MTPHDQPIGYRVNAIDGKGVFIDPFRKRSVIDEVFPTKEMAEARKRSLQATGMVASVTPVYLKWGKKAAKQYQSTPFGDFNRDWSLPKG